MQRFACLPTGERVPAVEAESRTDYLCPECHGVVRLRKGEERVAHFFHRNEGTSCHLRRKSGLHQAVQTWLLAALGREQCSQELYFHEISRVADIAFHPLQIVFEVQVSPIEVQHALDRTSDYWSIGWHVIWLLHASTFGKYRASVFERSLIGIPHYFTDIGYRGGAIWDELSAVRGMRRHWYLLPPCRQTIDDLSLEILREPLVEVPSLGFPCSASQMVHTRRQWWSCHLCHDLLSPSMPPVEERKRGGRWRDAWDKWKTIVHLFWLKCLGCT